MKVLDHFVGQRKLTLTLATLLSLMGVAAWFGMDRQEDPRLPEYWGQVIVLLPGADAETMERLVLAPIEEQLAQVEEIDEVVAKAQPELATLEVQLREATRNLPEAWDRVREALRDARPDLPEGATEPTLNDRQQDQESIVLAITGSADPLVLADAADRLKDRLLAIAAVSKVERIADPGEQVTVELDDAVARRLRLSPGALAEQLAARSRILPGGSLEVAGRNVRLRPQSEYETVAEIRAAPVRLPDGSTVPLSSVAVVRHGPEEPERTRMRVDGVRAVGLGVVPRAGINVVRFGAEVRERVAEMAPSLAPLDVQEIVFQPALVETRLDGLSRSLGAGALVVAGVLLLTMGLRLGFVVSAVVPMVALASLALYNLGGGVLQQMSIAALVIAIGMLVDNAIVVAENVQWRLDRGEPPVEASVGAIRELAVPLAGATATTLAAFVPMLMAESITADFTRSLPLVIMLTLVVSYVWALFVTPALGQLVLRPQPRTGPDTAARWGARIGNLVVRRPFAVLGVAVVLVTASLALLPLVRQEFFPSSDRAQIVVDVKLMEGSHLDATEDVSRRLERALSGRDDVTRVASYLGRSAPHFYYNLPWVPWTPHYAQIVVDLESTDALEPVLVFVRETARRDLPEAEIVGRKLEQGPPVAAPVEVRLYGDDFPTLARAADTIVSTMREVPGTADVRHSLSLGAPLARFQIDDAEASRRGLTRADVALALFGRTRGLPVGEYRGGDDPVPVVVRSSAGENLPVADLAALDVTGVDGTPVPLAQVSRLVPEWRPSVIEHRNHRRTVSVYSQLAPGVTYSDVTRELVPRLRNLDLPAGVEAEMGGAAESSGDANSAMVQIAPLAAALLIGILMAEFRSFRRVGIILTTVPLAAAGVIPGLLVGDQPFGFMSLLGVLALAGVVVNNAIVLLEVVEAQRQEGASIPGALRTALERRLRPILLTTATTVVGLFPLALSDSTLWPPMAWTMISGLVASAGLTLFVVPALYLLLFDGRHALPRLAFPFRSKAAARTAAVVWVLLSLPARAEDGPVRLGLEEAMTRAQGAPRVEAAESTAEAADRFAAAVRGLGWLPGVEVQAAASRSDRDLSLVTPIGSLSFGDRSTQSAALGARQPLLDLARQRFEGPAADSDAAGAAASARRVAQNAAYEAAVAYLDILDLDARTAANDAFVESLEARLEETEARVRAGRALEADALKVRLALDNARLERTALATAREVATHELGRAAGLDGPAEPAEGLPAHLPEPPGLDEAIARALSQRAELAALRERTRAAELRRKGVRAERVPRLEAFARANWASGTPYDQDRWLEGGVALTWRLYASGTIAPRAAAFEAERTAREADTLEAQRAIEVEVRRALSAYRVAREAVSVSETGVRQAAETLRVEEVRHREGRITTNDLLEAEAALRDQRTLLEVARVGVVRATVRLWNAMGQGAAGVERRCA